MKILWSDVLDGLKELSDSNLQQRLWIDGNDEMSSYTEAICMIFDDSGLGLSIEKGSLDEPLLRSFKELGEVIDTIPENEAPENIMSHPNMPKLQQLASKIISEITDWGTTSVH